MPTKYIPVSEHDQQFATLVERIFSDQAFAKSMVTNPAQALQHAGYHLTPEQVKSLAGHKVVATETLNLSFIRPAVNIITHGTRPAVSVATKGTQPVVSVAVNSVITAAEATHERLLTAEEVAKEAKQ